jgi:hypothetical protein
MTKVPQQPVPKGYVDDTDRGWVQRFRRVPGTDNAVSGELVSVDQPLEPGNDLTGIDGHGGLITEGGVTEWAVVLPVQA